MRLVRVGHAAAIAALAVAASLLMHCAKDDREDSAVIEIKDCPDLAALSTSDPKAPGATLRAFIEVAEELKAKSADAEKRLMAVCNEANAELGLAPGATAVAACQALSKRMEAVIKASPPVPPGPNAPPPWVELKFPPFCKKDPGAQAACVAKCAGPCDNTKCENAKIAGLCDGECKGECSTAGVDAPCTGKCQGACSGLVKTDCTGECVGQCGNGSFVGLCEGSCSVSAAGFAGLCKGLCTGVCDGTPVGTAPDPDGGAEAGPTGGVPCPGQCIGYCSDKAYGTCSGTCGGAFSGGPCVGGCTGRCNSNREGTACSTTCTGICTKPAGAACTGTCRGGCSVPLREAICEGTLECGQNIECRNACNAKAEAAITCTPTEDFQVFSAGDDALYKALRKHGARLGVLAEEIQALRSAQSFIAERTPSDFASIGANNDQARACSARGIKANTEALETIRNLITADPTARKFAL